MLRLLKNKTQIRGVYTGELCGLPVALALSGIGIANAARTATMLIERHSPSCLINFGIAGAYVRKGHLLVGDVAAAATETYADAGLLTHKGLVGFEAIGIPTLQSRGRRHFNDFALDRKLLRHATAACGGNKGMFLTVSAATGTKKAAGALLRRFPEALCENMEGAAVAHVCAHYGIAMAEVRGISNMVEDRDPSKWEIGLAAKMAQEAVMRLLGNLRS